MKPPALLTVFVAAATALSSGLASAGVPSTVNRVSIEATVPVTAEPAPNILVVPGQFTVRRSGDLTEELIVHLASRGTATPRADYRPLPERLVFATGEDRIELPVLAVDDNEVEEDETVIAILRESNATTPTYKIDPEHNRATVTINDTDRIFSRPLISIEATIPVTSEPAPEIRVIPGEFTIRRRGPLGANDLGEPLTVFLSYDGSATPGTDYGELPERVEFAAGEDTVTLRVVAVDDDEVEGDETVIAALHDPTLGPLPLYHIDPEHRAARVVIKDADRPSELPVVSVKATVPDTAEPAPNIDVVPGEFTVRRTGDLAESLTVNLATRGTATPRLDYEPLPEHVTFGPGEDTVELLVLAIDDNEMEDPESVILVLLGPDSNVAGYKIEPDAGRATVTIHDTDRPSELPVVCIKATRRIAEESAAPLRRINLVGEFTVSRTGPTLNPLPVWIHLSGTATPGKDYERLPWSVSIPAGESSVSIPVTAIFDRVPEGIETVIATVSPCPPDGLLAPCYAFEIDPDCARATVFIREDGLTVATIHITSPADGAQFAPGEPIPIRAVAIHLESFISHVVFCADGKRIGESEIVFIRAPDPGTPITHEFVWQRAQPGPHVLTAKTVIPGNDPNPGETTIVSSPVRITVGDEPPNEEPTGEFQSPQSGAQFPAGDPIAISIVARDPDGYITRVEFFADGLKIGEQNIAFFAEPPPGQLQTFNFNWENAMPGPHVLFVRLTDNEGATADTGEIGITVDLRDPRPIVNVVARDAFAVEPDANGTVDTATFRIRRHGSTTGDLTVHYTMHGRAGNGVDYERLPGSVVIPDGEKGVNVIVVPLADQERERGESVILRLEEDPAYETGDLRRAGAVIRDRPMPEPPIPPRCIRLADGLIHICFLAETGVCFRIESSSNLRDWSTLFCVIAIDGHIHLVHEQAPGFPGRFFRIAREPDGLANE